MPLRKNQKGMTLQLNSQGVVFMAQDAIMVKPSRIYRQEKQLKINSPTL